MREGFNSLLCKMVSIGEALDFPQLPVMMATGGVTMLAMFLLFVASPNVSDMTPLEQFSANLANQDKQASKQIVDDMLAKAAIASPDAAPAVRRVIPKNVKLRDLTVEELLSKSGSEWEEFLSEPDYPDRRTRKPTSVERQQTHIMALTGGKGLTASGPVDLTPNIDAELAAQAASVAKADKLKAEDSKAAQRSMPTPYLIGGGLLILIISYGAGVRRGKALSTSS